MNLRTCTRNFQYVHNLPLWNHVSQRIWKLKAQKLLELERKKGTESGGRYLPGREKHTYVPHRFCLMRVKCGVLAAKAFVTSQGSVYHVCYYMHLERRVSASYGGILLLLRFPVHPLIGFFCLIWVICDLYDLNMNSWWIRERKSYFFFLLCQAVGELIASVWKHKWFFLSLLRLKKNFFM